MTLDEFLQTREPFTSLSGEERASLASGCVKRTLADKEVLYNEGIPSDWVYLVTNGVIRIDLSHPNGTCFMLTPLKAGMMTDGEISEGAIHPVTASAMKETEVYLMPRASMKTLMQRNPAFLESFLSLRDGSMRYIGRVLSSTVSVSPEVRLARIILTFYKIFGDIDQTPLGYQFSQEALADMVACTRQSAAKILKQWRDDGLVEMKYKDMQILRADRLCDIAQWNHAHWRAGNGKADSWFSRLA